MSASFSRRAGVGPRVKVRFPGALGVAGLRLETRWAERLARSAAAAQVKPGVRNGKGYASRGIP